jgi:hypothetical protein
MRRNPPPNLRPGITPQKAISQVLLARIPRAEFRLNHSSRHFASIFTMRRLSGPKGSGVAGRPSHGQPSTLWPTAPLGLLLVGSLVEATQIEATPLLLFDQLQAALQLLDPPC